MTLPPIIIKSLQLAYSAEKAAAFAYIGHANSVSDPSEKLAIKQIENDEWDHRAHVLEIMNLYGITKRTNALILSPS
jgi:rubrerythrin